MPDSSRDVMSQWPAIEELALTRSRGLPFHDFLRNSKAGYDSKRDTLKLQLAVDALDKTTAESIRTCVSKACYQVLGFQPHLEVLTTTAPSPQGTYLQSLYSKPPFICVTKFL
jgi:hypothetical protein